MIFLFDPHSGRKVISTGFHRAILHVVVHIHIEAVTARPVRRLLSEQDGLFGHVEKMRAGACNPFYGAWRGAGSVGSSGLFGFFGLSGSENEINEINQIDQTNQLDCL